METFIAKHLVIPYREVKCYSVVCGGVVIKYFVHRNTVLIVTMEIPLMTSV